MARGALGSVVPKGRNLKFDLNANERRALRRIDLNVERKNKRYMRLSVARKMDEESRVGNSVKKNNGPSRLPVVSEKNTKMDVRERHKKRFDEYMKQKQMKKEIEKLTKKPVFKVGNGTALPVSSMHVVKKNVFPKSKNTEQPISARTRSRVAPSQTKRPDHDSNVLKNGNLQGKPMKETKFKYDAKNYKEFKIPGIQRYEFQHVDKSVSISSIGIQTRCAVKDSVVTKPLLRKPTNNKASKKERCATKLPRFGSTKQDSSGTQSAENAEKYVVFDNNGALTRSKKKTVAWRSPKEGEISQAAVLPSPKACVPSPPSQSVAAVDPIDQEMPSKVEDECPNTVNSMDGAHFRTVHQKEVSKIEALCSNWEPLAEDPSVPSDGAGNIRLALGLARLLVKEKLAQFEGLITDCELQRGEKKVMVSDLEGFWEMVQFQVEDVYKRFAELEALKEQGWVEQIEAVVPTNKNVKKVGKPKIKITANSSIKDHIKAIRDMKKTAALGIDKIFEKGFIKCPSPLPKESQLNKSVKMSATKSTKKSQSIRLSMTSPFVSNVMMRVSMQAKRQSVAPDLKLNLFEDTENIPSFTPVESADVPGGEVMQQKSEDPFILITPVKHMYGNRNNSSIQLSHEKDNQFDLMMNQNDTSSLFMDDATEEKVRPRKFTQKKVTILTDCSNTHSLKKSYPCTPQPKKGIKVSLLPGLDNSGVELQPLSAEGDLIQW